MKAIEIIFSPWKNFPTANRYAEEALRFAEGFTSAHLLEVTQQPTEALRLAKLKEILQGLPPRPKGPELKDVPELPWQWDPHTGCWTAETPSGIYKIEVKSRYSYLRFTGYKSKIFDPFHWDQAAKIAAEIHHHKK